MALLISHMIRFTKSEENLKIKSIVPIKRRPKWPVNRLNMSILSDKLYEMTIASF